MEEKRKTVENTVEEIYDLAVYFFKGLVCAICGCILLGFAGYGIICAITR